MSSNDENKSMQDDAVQTASNVENTDMGNARTKHGFTGTKKAAILGIVIAVLAVAAVAGAMNARWLSNLVKEKTSSPTEYYRYVERENRKDALEQVDTSYETLREDAVWKDQTRQMNCDIELGDTLKALTGSYGIESASLISSGKIEGSVVTGKSKLQLNGKDAISYQTYTDYSSGKSYAQIPELSGSYLELTELMQEASAELSLNDLYSVLSKLDEYLPKTDQINTLATTYSDIVLKNVKDVKRSEGNLEAGGVSGKYTKLDVTCSSKEVETILREILEELQDDKTVKELAEQISSDAYASFQKSVEDTLSDWNDSEAADDSGSAMMTVYVDQKAKIMGREIKLTSEGETFEIRIYKPTDGTQFGYEFAVGSNGTDLMTLTGSGEAKDGTLAGEFSLSMDESLNPGDGTVLSMTDLAKISVKDLDQKALVKEGVLKGNIEISTEQIPSVAGYSLKIKAGGTKDKIKDIISVMAGSDVFAKITLTTEKGGEDPGVTKPEEGATVYDVSDDMALTAYTSELDLTTFLADLQDKCGVNLSALSGLGY